MLHDYPLDDLTEMIKEETNELKLFMRAQESHHHFTTIAEWFIKLNLEVDLTHLEEFFSSKSRKK